MRPTVRSEFLNGVLALVVFALLLALVFGAATAVIGGVARQWSALDASRARVAAFEERLASLHAEVRERLALIGASASDLQVLADADAAAALVKAVCDRIAASANAPGACTTSEEAVDAAAMRFRARIALPVDPVALANALAVESGPVHVTGLQLQAHKGAPPTATLEFEVLGAARPAAAL